MLALIILILDVWRYTKVYEGIWGYVEVYEVYESLYGYMGVYSPTLTLAVSLLPSSLPSAPCVNSLGPGVSAPQIEASPIKDMLIIV